jgi:hypothetical protein
MLSNNPSVAMRMISPGITEMDAEGGEKKGEVREEIM